MKVDADVIVVGAGLAGLSAAALLCDPSLNPNSDSVRSSLASAKPRVLVLEARDRVGGRTYSVPFALDRFGQPLAFPITVDLGGQWIGGSQNLMYSLLARFGIQTSPQPDEGTHILYTNGNRMPYVGNISSLNNSPNAHVKVIANSIKSLEKAVEELDAMAKNIDPARPQAHAEAEALDSISMDAWLAKKFPEDSVSSPSSNSNSSSKSDAATARSMLEWFVRAVFSTEPSAISLYFFLYFLRTAGGYAPLSDIRGGAQQDRILGGAQQISERLADIVGRQNVFLNCPVSQIKQYSELDITSAANVTGGGEAGIAEVTVEDGRKFRAKYVLVALPPALQHRISFFPALPMDRMQLALRSTSGCCIKTIVGYKTAWWLEKGLSAECISDQFPIFLTYDDTTPEGKPAIIGFCVGHQAVARFGAMSPQEREKMVIDFLANMFGEQARTYDLYVDKNWSDEVYSGGCYVSYLQPGALAAYGQALRRPFGKVHWAGTETAREWQGYMHGAVESGYRAAEEIAARLAQRSRL
ncbi:mitochondrial monoamine oxidase A isoform 2 (MAO_2) [Andalucia godoyi]|uniref:Amine oxidase n=1 Tax=Andalucia godoyi TaxID=505711 RepID=A0A8K0AHE2_ANDGO|nr:mitochondrial monoamine oxidase A isoform 2 (MAO_2) [Andalucia godoyi]|eukprot:ANDGO_03933.mRNA.1 mitochondrial monoamine oxidase A isoform 2 (MAO_2)